MKISAKNNSRLFLVFLLGAVIRFGCEGFVYYPYLDDYVQYMYYPSLPLYGGVFFGGAKTVYTRPLASVFDVFIWGKMGNNLVLAMLILAVLYGLSGIFFYKALAKGGISVSPLFLVIYGLCPLNTEGTYWVSASSRIATALFFASLGLWFLIGYLKEKGAGNFILFALFHFLSYWFYEQVSAVSFLVCLWFSLKEKSIKSMAVTVLCSLAFALWYILLGKMGSNGTRLETVGASGIFASLVLSLKEIFYVFTRVFPVIMLKGLIRGFTALLSSPLWVVAIGGLTWMFAREAKTVAKSKREGLILGIVLFFGAFAPFYITKNVWFNLRNFVPAGLGAGLIIDFFAAKLSQRAFKGVLGAVMVWFLIVQMSEVADYNAAAYYDSKIANSLKEAYEKTGKPTLVLKGDLPEYLSQNSAYHDHIVTGSTLDWGCTGMVRGLTKNPEITVKFQKTEP